MLTITTKFWCLTLDRKVNPHLKEAFVLQTSNERSLEFFIRNQKSKLQQKVLSFWEVFHSQTLKTRQKLHSWLTGLLFLF